MKAMWRSTNGPYGDATEIADYLEHLRSKEDLTIGAVIADAEDRSSPLHKYFEWNDTDAARKYRKIQVGVLMNRLVRPNGRRVYTRIKKSDGVSHYDLVTRVLRSPALRRPIARRGLMELKNWEVRYADFPELQGAIQALQSALKNVVRPALKEMDEVSV